MIWLEIMMMGILINFLFMVILGVLTIVLAIADAKTFDGAKSAISIQMLGKEVESLKAELKSKNISTKTQEDYAIFVPFAFILIFLKFLFGVVNYGGINNYINYLLIEKMSLFEQRLLDYK